MDRFLEAHRAADEPDQKVVEALRLDRGTIERLLAEGYTLAELADLTGKSSYPREPQPDS